MKPASPASAMRSRPTRKQFAKALFKNAVATDFGGACVAAVLAVSFLTATLGCLVLFIELCKTRPMVVGTFITVFAGTLALLGLREWFAGVLKQTREQFADIPLDLEQDLK